MESQKSCKGIISVLCIIIVILLVLVVLISTGIISFKSNEQQVNENNNSLNMNVSQKSSVSKSQILSYYKEKISSFTDSNHQYSVVDINNDDIPELFM